MKQLLLCLAVLIQVSAHCQTKIYLDKDWKETSKNEAEYYRIIEKKSNLYQVKDYFITGELQFEALSHTNTEPYELEGEVKTYEKNGQLVDQRSFKNNVPVGEMTSYYSNGTLKAKGQYKDGQFDGLYTEYFPSGKIANQATFANGVINGTHTKYQSDDELEFKVNYKNGVLNGPYEFYNFSGRLFNKGNAENGFQQGKCYDYFYEGGLRKEYTVNNKKLDGILIEYSATGDTIGKGVFKAGVPLYYKMAQHGSLNGSKFGGEMQLVDGIENWKIYRDSALVLKSFYKDGVKTGIWQVYTFDGSALYQTRDYTNADCSEKYLQTTKDKFDPFFFLSDRFNFGAEVLKDGDCGVKMEQISNNEDLHPFYHFKNSSTKPVKKKNDDIIEYTDPTHKNGFAQKNNCVDTYKTYSDVSVCTREMNGTTYKVFISENLERLKTLKAEAKPGDKEVYFYYQRFKDRTYDFSKEPHPKRYMGFALPNVIKEALKEKRMNESAIVKVLEHDFWNVDDFSGLSAFSALEDATEEQH